VTAGERRVVSALVADVAGSTAIGERLGPERSKFLLDEVVRLMREEVERFGGTVAQLTGDGVLALFGAPVAHQDDAVRAVRAALALRESIARYAAEIAPAYGIELAARVAVNTGPVVVPAIAAPVDVLYNALGDTVNVAARLQALGDIVVGPTTARQVGDTFELEELGEVELKGKSLPVAAFRVVGVRMGPSLRSESPLVGREAELAALDDALAPLLGGRGAIISVTGESGIGKSRLVAESEKRLTGVRFLVGHAVAYAGNIPYWPVRELLRSWLDLGLSDSEARTRLELRAELARSLKGDATEAYPFLAALLGLALELDLDQRRRDLAPDAAQHETFHWLYELIRSLAKERPLCLVFEDLHWSDEATLALLDELLPVVEESPVGFLLVHRSDPDHPGWQLVDRARRRFRRSFSELEVAPLPDEQVRALAEADAGGTLPEALGRLLAERAGGNPYFVSEALRDLRERGVLGGDVGRVTLVGEASIPAALQETVQARLDRLDAEARELVTTAAVIGRSFSLPLLERLLPGARLLPTLSELQWLELLVAERNGAAPEYRFRHGIVQEVAYGSLLDDQRRELHLRVGEALIDLHRDSPAEVYGLLARHFSEADEPHRAVEYLLKAGDAARAANASDEANQLYRHALGFMERTGDDTRARRTLLKIALTHHLAFDFRAANQAFGEAFARPAPELVRLAPTERITTCVSAAWGRELTPGHDYSLPGFYVMRNLFRGLLALGPDLEIEPDVAERFTVSDDGRSYLFTLREDAAWSDGTPVTASDFAFTFAQMIADDVETAFWLDGLTAIGRDDGTLELRLRQPRNDFLYALTQPPLFPWPRHVYEAMGRDWHSALPVVGNGPFVITRREEDLVVMEAVPTWRGARGNVSEVMVEIEASQAVITDGWQRGHYDVLHELVDPNMVADGQTVVERSPGMLTWYLGFNGQRAPVDDSRVRRALAHAIDRGRLVEPPGANPSVAGGMIPPTMPGHSHRVAPQYDPERSRGLLAEAGFADGAALGEIVLACLDPWADAASDICAHLARIGVMTRLLIATSDPELEVAIEDHAHAFLWVWGADYPAPGGVLDLLLGSRGVFRDEQLEQLLARAAGLRDNDERLRTYRQFERIWIGEQAAVVPIAYGDSILCRRPWVTGMWVNSTEVSNFAHAVVTRLRTQG
jgi:ABC-type transport system substrate-binding protein/class 3 adenylate cyclase